MASPPLAIAKNKHFGCLLEVNRTITTLTDICNDPEEQEPDRVATATTRLEEAWRKYEEGQQDVLDLTAEDQVEDKLYIFSEMEEICENAIDRANKSSKKRKTSGRRKGKMDGEDGGTRPDAQPGNPHPGRRQARQYNPA